MLRPYLTIYVLVLFIILYFIILCHVVLSNTAIKTLHLRLFWTRDVGGLFTRTVCGYSSKQFMTRLTSDTSLSSSSHFSTTPVLTSLHVVQVCSSWKTRGDRIFRCDAGLSSVWFAEMLDCWNSCLSPIVLCFILLFITLFVQSCISLICVCVALCN